MLFLDAPEHTPLCKLVSMRMLKDNRPMGSSLGGSPQGRIHIARIGTR
jgi:hypothetical protein